MTHLLDTNAWLRSLENAEALSAPAFRTISTLPPASLALSAISVWEVALKVRHRKLTLSQPFAAWLQVALRPGFVRVLPLDADLARFSQELPGDFHEDPGDRFIVATAIRHNLTLITSDGKILDYPHVRTLW